MTAADWVFAAVIVAGLTAIFAVDAWAKRRRK